MTADRRQTTISTTKPVDVEVCCDSCGMSIDDGATLTWNPLAAAIECGLCAAKEARARRLVVATVTRSRRPDAPDRSGILDEPDAVVEPGATQAPSTSAFEVIVQPTIHVFDVQSAVADAVALVTADPLADDVSLAGGIVDDDDDTVEIEFSPVTAEECRSQVEPVIGAATPTGFAPPDGLRSLSIPAPFPTAPAGRSSELVAVLPTTSPVTLSDRRIPKSRSAIGHIVVTPTGVFVIEQCLTIGGAAVAKRRGSERVCVGGVDQSKTLKRIRLARRAVSGLLAGVGAVHVEVRCVLMVAASSDALLTSDAIEILSPEQLDAAIARRGAMEAHEISELAERLAERFTQH